MCSRACARMCVHVRACVRACVCAHMCARACVRMCVRVRACVTPRCPPNHVHPTPPHPPTPTRARTVAGTTLPTPDHGRLVPLPSVGSRIRTQPVLSTLFHAVVITTLSRPAFDVPSRDRTRVSRLSRRVYKCLPPRICHAGLYFRMTPRCKPRTLVRSMIAQSRGGIVQRAADQRQPS
jgi:hypothetical protein